MLNDKGDTMRKITVLTFALMIAPLCNADKKEESKYPINVPHAIDGRLAEGFCIDGHQIHNMLYIVKEVQARHLGDTSGTHHRTGHYECEGNKYSIHDLALLEAQGALTPALKAMLPVVIDDLLAVAEPFIEQGRNVKAMTLQFLNEWAAHHHREQSFLLHWSSQEDGKEIEIFKQEVTSFAQLHEFCRDLVSFLSDLIKSCPHALEQFKAMKKHHLQ